MALLAGSLRGKELVSCDDHNVTCPMQVLSCDDDMRCGALADVEAGIERVSGSASPCGLICHFLCLYLKERPSGACWQHATQWHKHSSAHPWHHHLSTCVIKFMLRYCGASPMQCVGVKCYICGTKPIGL